MSDYQAEAGRGDHGCCAFARNAGVIGSTVLKSLMKSCMNAREYKTLKSHSEKAIKISPRRHHPFCPCATHHNNRATDYYKMHAQASLYERKNEKDE
jgi:hypothetical protein